MSSPTIGPVDFTSFFPFPDSDSPTAKTPPTTQQVFRSSMDKQAADLSPPQKTQPIDIPKSPSATPLFSRQLFVAKIDPPCTKSLPSEKEIFDKIFDMEL